MTSLYLAQDKAADAFLRRDPLGLIIALVLDQQIPLERAFSAPAQLADRLGVTALDAAQLAETEPEKLATVFSQRPALHRFPGAMAGRTQAMCRIIVEQYDNDAAKVWTSAESGAELLKRIQALPGFGKQKAKIFLALLGKQFGVTAPGWEQAAGEFGAPGSYLSVADIVDEDSLNKVREHKKAMKASAKAS
ncbi:MAG: Fe-S cluster assembly protein HesB [Corynebacteriales bacterium]|nr:Fe-S cluster assembly protein HesB [Mycobacteriales bacterium]